MSCAMLLCAMLFRANDQQYFAINAKLRNKDENMALSALKNQIKTIYLYSKISIVVGNYVRDYDNKTN